MNLIYSKRMFFTLEAEFVLAYDPVQPENYDAALHLNEYDEEKLKETISCTCGVTSADQIRKSCIPFPNYNTKCKCYTSQSCTSIYWWKYCANSNGDRRGLPSKQKCTLRSLQIPLPNRRKFPNDQGESVVAGVWLECEMINPRLAESALLKNKGFSWNSHLGLECMLKEYAVCYGKSLTAMSGLGDRLLMCYLHFVYICCSS